MELNKDSKARDLIIFDKLVEDNGDIIRFEGLTLEKLDRLLDQKFADPEETQNDSPSTKEIYDFMKEHPGFTAHGYVVSRKRNDYGISLEGVEYRGNYNKKVLLKFLDLFAYADELTTKDKYLRAWYD